MATTLAPTVLYDDACRLCQRLARFAQRYARKHPDDYILAGSHQADLDSLGVTSEQCDAALLWVDRRGEVLAGVAAWVQILLASRWPFRLAGHMMGLPGMRWIAGMTYQLVSTHRHRLGCTSNST